MNPIKRITSSLGALALCLSPALGFAQGNLLGNGSFETVPFAMPVDTGGFVDGSYCYTDPQRGVSCDGALDAWTGLFPLMTSTSRPWGATPATATDHFQVGLQDHSFIQQSVLIEAAGTYTLTWSDAGRRYFDDQRYQVSFGGVVLATADTLAGQGWSTHSVSFNVGAGSQLLTFQGLNTRGDATAFIDNVSLTSAVPEPTSWALMFGGLVGIGFVASRRHRND